jgi:hypothetical protein
MKKQLDLTRYFLRQDGNRIAPYIQDGLEFGLDGVSLRDFPEPKKIILSQTRQPYKTIKAGEQALGLKKLNSDEYEIVPYKNGYAIKER